METKINITELKYITKLIFDYHNIPIFLLDNTGNIINEYTSNFSLNPLISSKKELFSQLNTEVHHPIIVTTMYLETFITLNIPYVDQRGQLIIGPIMADSPSEEIVDLLKNDVELSDNDKEDFVQYFLSLPTLKLNKVIILAKQLYYMIYQVKISSEDVKQLSSEIAQKAKQITNPNLIISNKRQSLSLHHDDTQEKKVFKAIEQGKKDDVLTNYRAVPESGKLGILSKKSYLRHKKNFGIAAITLATRAAIKGGLHYETAYTLSDLYIQNIEDINKTNEIDVYIEEILCEFAERVQKARQQNFSKPINKTLNYIFNHLYDTITLADLAEAVSLHPSYLSKLFKLEVGVNIRDYILQSKIDEAKSLISLTDYSLLKISTLLNFNDQSYFTKTFRKHVGLTPKQYKEKL
ncbi:helix-turn-helix domain-containing protein [Gracilibacillus suaedae]|uniref:helix-turn-helix domain-containing protein n=1 Tax=Gracilibacillus suaedae TaxID=2820273 RepID=UPI001ABE1D76|nr:helix-turn-helix domain-containing protein [Gracilibacillus suaedae]